MLFLKGYWPCKVSSVQVYNINCKNHIVIIYWQYCIHCADRGVSSCDILLLSVSIDVMLHKKKNYTSAVYC